LLAPFLLANPFADILALSGKVSKFSDLCLDNSDLLVYNFSNVNLKFANVTETSSSSDEKEVIV